MKTFLLFIFSSLYVFIHAQDSLLFGSLPMKEGKVNYEIIITIDSASKNKLFAIIKDWAINNYRSEKDALQSEDKESGYLAYKGNFDFGDTLRWGTVKPTIAIFTADHTLKFYIKEGRIKANMTDIEVKYLFGDKSPVERWKTDEVKPNSKRVYDLNRAAKILDTYILAYLTDIEKTVKEKSKKSDFDF